MAGHAGVDLARELDEARGDAVFPRLPGEIEGVDGDAMPAEPGAGIEGHEAEGLGLGRFDDFPDIDSHGGIDELQFIDEGDVDGAEDVLAELHRLCHLDGRDRYALYHDLA